jgi:histidyl-tRNA synthetase
VAFEKAANLLGIDVARYDDACRFVTDVIRPVVPGIPVAIRDHEELQVLGHGRYVNPVDLSLLAALLSGHDERPHSFNTAGIVQRWAELDLSIVRGLAYYTGLVFEAIADGERAVAGGGRYDKLIELMGGPPTPAVGFGMGDVVLSLLLDDKGLMPAGPDLLDACSRPSASLRPQAFVIAANPEHDAAMTRLLADLRRGPQDEKSGELRPWQRPAGLHARRSYKSTRNVGKLLDDARKQHALVAVMLDAEASDAAAPSAKLEHLVTRQTKEKVPFERINAEVRSMLGA